MSAQSLREMFLSRPIASLLRTPTPLQPLADSCNGATKASPPACPFRRLRLQRPYRPGQPMLLKPVLEGAYDEVVRFHFRAVARLLDGVSGERLGRGRVHIKGGARGYVTQQLTPLPPSTNSARSSLSGSGCTKVG
jgi:hypothetical protein